MINLHWNFYFRKVLYCNLFASNPKIDVIFIFIFPVKGSIAKLPTLNLELNLVNYLEINLT